MTPSATTALRPPLYSTYGWTERLGILDLLAPFFLSSPNSSATDGEMLRVHFVRSDRWALDRLERAGSYMQRDLFAPDAAGHLIRPAPRA